MRRFSPCYLFCYDVAAMLHAADYYATATPARYFDWPLSFAIFAATAFIRYTPADGHYVDYVLYAMLLPRPRYASFDTLATPCLLPC